MKAQSLLIGLTFAASTFALPNILHPTAPSPPAPEPTEYRARGAAPEIVPADNWKRLPKPEHGADWPRLPAGYKRHEDHTPPHSTGSYPPIPPPGPTGYLTKRGATPPGKPDFPHPPGSHPHPPGPTGGYPSHEPFRFRKRGGDHIPPPPPPPYPTGGYVKRNAGPGHDTPYPPPAPTGGYPHNRRNADGAHHMPGTPPPHPTGYPTQPEYPHDEPSYNFPKLMPRHD